MEWKQQGWVNAEGSNNNAANIPFSIGRKFSPGINEMKKSIEGEDSEKNDGKVVKMLDSIFKFSLFAIFLGIPLFFTNLTFQGIAFEKQMYFYFWILIALIAWGSKSGYVGEMKIKKTPLDIPIISFWLFYLIATIFSADRWHSFVGFFGDPSRGFISITAMIILYYLVLSNFSQNLFKWLMRAVIFSGAIAIIWDLLRIFNIKLFFGEKLWSSLPVSTIGSLQSAAIFACFMIFIFMTAILKIRFNDEISNLKKNIYSFILAFFIAASLLVVLALYNYIPLFSHFPLAGLVIGAAFFVIFILAKIVRPKDAWTLLPMVIFIVVLAFLMIGPVNISRVNLPLNVSVPYGTASEIAKGSLGDSFFIGYGPGNYGYAFSKFLPQNFDNMNLRFFEGEGLIFESISTLGVIGTVLLIILILTFLGTSIFLLYREKERNKIYSLGVLSATIVLLINALVSQSESSIIILMVIMGTLTTGVLFMESDIKGKIMSFSLKTSPKFALTLAFISLLIFASVAFLFVFFGKIYAADLYMGQAIRSEKVSEEGSIAKIGKAINLNQKESRYFSRLGQEYLVLTNDEMLKGEQERDINKIKAYLASGVQAGVFGRNLMPKDVNSVETLAQIYENSGIYLAEGYESAAKEYQKALELEPNNPAFYVRLGIVKTKIAATKEKSEDKKVLIEEAKELFKQAIEVRKNFDSAYYNLASTEEALGQMDEAIEDMKKAVSIQGNNVNYVFNLARMLQSRGKDDDNKIAEALFKQILGVNDKEINTHFNLGLLYEKTSRKAEAAAEYAKVIELLPEGSEKTKEQLDKMIGNIKNGIENTPESLGLTGNNAQESSVQNNSNEESLEQDQSPAPQEP